MARTSSSRAIRDEKIYLNWPGKNILLCGGRLLLGPDVRQLTLTFIVTLFPGIVFVGLIWPWYFLRTPLYVSIPLLACGLLGFIFLLFIMAKVSMMDPGIIPRKTIPSSGVFHQQTNFTDLSTLGDSRLPIPPIWQTVYVDGEEISLKYCYTCHMYRPPRCSHCTRCNNCVSHLDHHCPWLGTCIGRRNYRYFILFLVTAFLMISLTFCVCLVQIGLALYMRITENDVRAGEIVWNIFRDLVPPIFLFLYLIPSYLFVLILIVFHTYLMCKNQTTSEHLKRKTDKISYNQGPLKNCFYVWCNSIDKSSKLQLRKTPSQLKPKKINITKSLYPDQVDENTLEELELPEISAIPDLV